MPDQQVTDFQPMTAADPNARGEPQRSARDIAREAASEVVRGPSTARPGTTFDSTTRTGGDHGENLPSDESQFAQFEEQPPRQDFEGGETDEEFEARQDEYDDHQARQSRRAGEEDLDDFEAEDDWDESDFADFTDDDVAALAEMGIELPVSPDEVPEEFRGTYAQLAQSVIDTRMAANDQIRDAQEAILQVQDFAERVSTPEGQKRMLLTMSLNNPEVFSEAVQQVRRMQDDPDYAESVRRQMEAEMKYEAATRKERALSKAEITRKAQQIEGRATRLARRHGIDPQFAREQVGARILQNEARTGRRDISLQEVDEVISGLAKRMGGRRRAKTPQARQREKRAPTNPAQGAGRQPPSQDRQPTQQGPRPAQEGRQVDPRDAIRNAVQQAAKRTRSRGL